MELEQSVAQHYTHGSLEGAIFGALATSGKDLDYLAPADLAPVDEFHIGGRQATTEFAAELEIEPGLHLTSTLVLDWAERRAISRTNAGAE